MFNQGRLVTLRLNSQQTVRQFGERCLEELRHLEKGELQKTGEVHDAGGVCGLTPKVSGAGAPKVRRAPTLAMKMPKAWPVLASA